MGISTSGQKWIQTTSVLSGSIANSFSDRCGVRGDLRGLCGIVLVHFRVMSLSMRVTSFVLLTSGSQTILASLLVRGQGLWILLQRTGAVIGPVQDRTGPSDVKARYGRMGW